MVNEDAQEGLSRGTRSRDIATSPEGQDRTPILFGSSGKRVGSRVEVEAPAVEVDGGLEVLSVTEAVGHFLDGLDLRVEALTDGVRDAVSEEGQDVRQVALDEAGGLDHGRQARMGRPEIPPLPMTLGPPRPGVVPELAQALLDRPGAAGLKRGR